MKVLFISFWVWSEHNPEGIVSKKILNGFKKNNIKVDIITSEDFILKDGKKFIFKNFSNNFQNIINKIISRIFGCPNIIFILKAIKYLKKNINTLDYDIVFSRSEPITTHIIALYLRKKMKKKVKFIFSFSDPGYLNPFLSKTDVIKRFFYYVIEKKIIKKGDIITYTNSYLKKIYLNKYPQHKDKFKVLCNPIEENEIILSNNIFKKIDYNNPIFCYTGTLTPQRNLDMVLKYFKFLKNNDIKPKIFIIGGVGVLAYNKILGEKISSFLIDLKLKKILKNWKLESMSENIEFLPFMNRSILSEYIEKNIDILVNIDANLGKNNIFVSSKIVDYISYSKPILNFTNKGASSEFLKDFCINKFINYDEENFYILSKNNINNFIPHMKNIKKYTNKEVISNLIKDLEEV